MGGRPCACRSNEDSPNNCAVKDTFSGSDPLEFNSGAVKIALVELRLVYWFKLLIV